MYFVSIFLCIILRIQKTEKNNLPLRGCFFTHSYSPYQSCYIFHSLRAFFSYNNQLLLLYALFIASKSSFAFKTRIKWFYNRLTAALIIEWPLNPTIFFISHHTKPRFINLFAVWKPKKKIYFLVFSARKTCELDGKLRLESRLRGEAERN